MLHHPISKTRVFLSYARADDAGSDRSAYDDPARSFMRRVYNRLTQEGFDVWWDMVSMPSRGEEFTAEIEAAIRSCDRFVLVVGPGAVKSGYVRAEWQYALSCCLPITPMLRAGDYSLIPKEIANVNAVDGRPGRDENAALDELVSKLRESALPLGRLVNVPYLPSKFLPREKPFSQAREAVRADAIQPVVVSAPPRATAMYGYGGVGKSTLAAAVAQDCAVRRRFKDGVYWIEIGQHPEITSRQADLGALLGDQREHYTDPTAGKMRLSYLLADKQALVVLDDVWDHRVVEYFPAGSACRWLLTTRSRQVASLVDGVDVQLDLLTPEEGAQLIAMYAKGSADDPTYLAISRELGGHTLAVTLAARRLEEGTMSASELLNRLQQPERLFKDLKLHEDDRNLNLEKSLSLSYEALKDDMQRRFRALGVLALDSPFGLGVLQAVWGDEEALDAEDALNVLVREGLVEAQGGGRFRQHRLLRAYARALAEKKGELDDFFQRHADWAIAQAEQLAEPWKAPRSAIELDLPHVLAVGDELTASQRSDAGERLTALLIALGHFFFIRADVLGDRIAWYERAAAHARQQGNRAALGTLLYYVSSLYETRGMIERALAALDESRAIRVEQNDPREIADTQHALADLYVKLGRWDEARALYEASLTTFQQLNDPREIAATQHALADLYVQLGRWDEALALYEASLTTKQQLNDPRGIAVTQGALADLYVQLGRWDEARALYEASLTTKQQLNDPREIAVTQGALAGLYVKLGRWDEARALYQASLTTFQQLNDPRGIADTQHNLADLYVKLGRWDEARALYQASLTTSQQLNDPRGIAATQHALADLYVQLGRWDEARALYEASLTTFQQLNDPRGIAATQSALADLYVQLGRWDEALALYEASLTTKQQLNDLRSIAVTQSALADLYVKLGRWDEARALYQASLTTFQQLNDPRGIAATQHALADLYVQLGRWDEARALYEASLTTKQQLNDPRGIAATQINLAQLLIMRGENLPRALTLLWEGYAVVEKLNNPHEIQAVRDILLDFRSRLGAGKFDRLWSSTLSTPQPDWLTSSTAVSVPDLLEESIMGLLRQVWAQGGVEAVRALLQTMDLSESEIKALLRQLSE